MFAACVGRCKAGIKSALTDYALGRTIDQVVFMILQQGGRRRKKKENHGWTRIRIIFIRRLEGRLPRRPLPVLIYLAIIRPL